MMWMGCSSGPRSSARPESMISLLVGMIFLNEGKFEICGSDNFEKT